MFLKHVFKSSVFQECSLSQDLWWEITYFKSCCCHLDKLGQTNTLNEKFLDAAVIMPLYSPGRKVRYLPY